MATHQVIICTKEAKRLSVIPFDHYGDWVSEAKDIALGVIGNSKFRFLQWQVENRCLTVWVE
jgi:hypothetical protein